MAQFLVTYDLKKTNPAPWSAVRDQGPKHGWYLWIAANDGTKAPLPNTTMHGYFETIDAAVLAFTNVIIAAAAQIGGVVVVEKRIVVAVSDCRITSDVWLPNT